MYQNYVVEVKQTFGGEFEHQVYWLWDENEPKGYAESRS